MSNVLARMQGISDIIVHDKTTAQNLLDQLLILYKSVGIKINPKKTKISKLEKGFVFLKTHYYLTDTGKVVRKACHDSVVRERRKIKKLHRLYLTGDVSYDRIEPHYMSWRGSIMKHDAYRSAHEMDKLYYQLFGKTPWKKKH